MGSVLAVMKFDRAADVLILDVRIVWQTCSLNDRETIIYTGLSGCGRSSSESTDSFIPVLCMSPLSS